MSKTELLARIQSNPAVVTGKPVIRGTRLTVDFIVGLLASGATPEEITSEYPGVSGEDIQACLLFAAQMLEDTSFVPLAA